MAVEGEQREVGSDSVALLRELGRITCAFSPSPLCRHVLGWWWFDDAESMVLRDDISSHLLTTG